jgi:hypothetical protein
VSINFIPADSTSIPPEDSSLTPFNSSVNADQNNQQSPEFADNLTLNIHHDGDTGPADGSEDAVMEDVNLQRPEWDFSLPELPFPGDLVPGVGDENGDFSAERLAAAMQHRIAVDAARTYMNSYDIGTVQRLINDEVDGFPVIFYAVAANDERMVRLLLESGADASSIHDGTRTPLLGFAIICGETLQQDTTSIVSLLLSYGASPHVVPQELISPYDKDLAAVSKSDGDGGEVTKETAWCTKTARMKLAKATNITHRYYLDRAAKMKKPSRKRRQVAQLRNAERLLGVPYFLIGQPIASDLLIQRLLAYLIRPTSHPLVLCFAGPSGHGKTELARQLGQLLSLDLEVVDCTVVNREIELFGPRDPYVGAEKGSPVNNFLAEHNGKRCIVFFDEFEKTTKEIHQSLLLPFDNGRHRYTLSSHQTNKRL